MMINVCLFQTSALDIKMIIIHHNHTYTYIYIYIYIYIDMYIDFAVASLALGVAYCSPRTMHLNYRMVLDAIIRHSTHYVLETMHCQLSPLTIHEANNRLYDKSAEGVVYIRHAECDSISQQCDDSSCIARPDNSPHKSRYQISSRNLSSVFIYFDAMLDIHFGLKYRLEIVYN